MVAVPIKPTINKYDQRYASPAHVIETAKVRTYEVRTAYVHVRDRSAHGRGKGTLKQERKAGISADLGHVDV